MTISIPDSDGATFRSNVNTELNNINNAIPSLSGLMVKASNLSDVATQQDVSKYNQIVQLSTVPISHFVSEINQDVSTQMAGPSDVYSETSNE